MPDDGDESFYHHKNADSESIRNQEICIGPGLVFIGKSKTMCFLSSRCVSCFNILHFFIYSLNLSTVNSLIVEWLVGWNCKEDTVSAIGFFGAGLAVVSRRSHSVSRRRFSDVSAKLKKTGRF